VKRFGVFLVALLLASRFSAAQTPLLPQQINVRYDAQISNAPAGTCGCFTLQGGAADADWRLIGLDRNRIALGLVADVGVNHTGTVEDANYGLTFSTFTFGPRVTAPVAKKISAFGQVLLGLAHGSGSQFPQGSSLVPSASSFALNLGAGGDYRVNQFMSIRVLQVGYIRSQLPNTTSNWQNNLSIGAGLTFHLHR
jgi:hypothetical protein